MPGKDHGPRIGADPELFVQDLDGTVVPICGKIGGTKENPFVINKLIEGQFGPEVPPRRPRIRDGREEEEFVNRIGDYAVQEDNVMLEFNVPAYRDAGCFVDSITKILTTIESEILAPKNLRSKIEVMHTFKTEDLDKIPQAGVVGCLSDMDAYAEEGNRERVPFNAAAFGSNRFCGGHVHVQYNYGNVPRHIFGQYMDLFAQLPFLRWDKQKMRRMFYGQPGIYREKPYGIEYRTPSNFWISSNFRNKGILSNFVENISSLANLANKDPENLKQNYSRIDWSDVQKAIRTEDAKLGDDLVEYARHKLGFYMCAGVNR